MYLDLYHAIEHRHLIQMLYGSYYRVVEPRVFGSDARGMDILKAYQVAGCDGSGRDIGWKWFNARDIGGIVVLTTKFHWDRDETSPNLLAMRRVYCQVTV